MCGVAFVLLDSNHLVSLLSGILLDRTNSAATELLFGSGVNILEDACHQKLLFELEQ